MPVPAHLPLGQAPRWLMWSKVAMAGVGPVTRWAVPPPVPGPGGGEAANSPACTVAGSPARSAAPTVRQWLPSAESYRHQGWAAARPVGQGVRCPGGAAARPARPAVRRGPARTGVGRARRPVLQRRHGHGPPAPPQARRPPSHRDHHQRRLSHHRHHVLIAASAPAQVGVTILKGDLGRGGRRADREAGGFQRVHYPPGREAGGTGRAGTCRLRRWARRVGRAGRRLGDG
jgi:hypothetical protein